MECDTVSRWQGEPLLETVVEEAVASNRALERVADDLQKRLPGPHTGTGTCLGSGRQRGIQLVVG
jgi:hypothetical protein